VRRLGERGAGDAASCREHRGKTWLRTEERGARLRKVEEVGLGLPELSPGSRYPFAHVRSARKAE